MDLRRRLETTLGKDNLWQDRTRLEGGVNWWNQITEALEVVQFMVLIATPAAMQSAIVTKEWRYARQKGVCVYPVRVPDQPIDVGSLPSWMKSLHFYTLEKEWDNFLIHLQSNCHAENLPFMPLDLPSHHIIREREFAILKAKIIDIAQRLPLATPIALKGVGGFGKTTLATALCHDEDMQELFSDGILWVTLGETPDVLGALIKLYAAFTEDHPALVDIEEASIELSRRLRDKKCLLVIDDVWQVPHLRPFLNGGENCVRLITTRSMDVAIYDDSQLIEVTAMTDIEAVSLLSSNIDGITQPNEYAYLAKRLGNYPLILELANGVLRKRMKQGKTSVEAIEEVKVDLDEVGFTIFDRRDAASPNDAVSFSLNVSLKQLTENERNALIELTIFAENIDIPAKVLNGLWNVDERKVRRLCALFDDLSLIHYSGATNTIRLHKVIRGVLSKKLENISDCHSRLISSWGDAFALQEPFAWRWYLYHLQGAGTHIRSFLLNYRWLRAKLEALDANALLSDFDYERDDDDLRLIKSAVSLATDILNKDKRQFAGQLIGRLMSYRDTRPAIDALLTDAATYTDRPAFLPNTQTLTQAGGALIRKLIGHNVEVTDAEWSPDGTKIVSASQDTTLRVWDSLSGFQSSTFIGHKKAINAAKWSPDGTKIVSASQDKTIRVWDVNTQQEIFSIFVAAQVTSAAWSPDGTKIVSASADGKLKVWDVKTQQMLSELAGQEDKINNVTWSPDGTKIASASDDGTLRIWDASTSNEIVTVSEHTGDVTAIDWSPDSSKIVSASRDRTIKIWDANNGNKFQELNPAQEVTAVAWSRDGSRILSASSKSITMWDSRTEQILWTSTETMKNVKAVSWSPDDSRIVSTSEDNVLIWDANVQQIPSAVVRHQGIVNTAAFTPDGSQIISSSSDEILLWDVYGETLKEPMNGYARNINANAWSRDGIVVVSMVDKLIKLWVAKTGKEVISPLIGHTGKVRSAVFASHNEMLLSAGDDSTIRLWDITTGMCLARFDVDSAVYCVANSPNGQLVTAGDEFGNVHIFQMIAVSDSEDNKTN